MRFAFMSATHADTSAGVIVGVASGAVKSQFLWLR
ncbi:hypothetical protein FHS82_001039 [Pseudochelatococcus lubricantis]|uniref:Uncharacterized protein n=1 Tax=Pseudochelatococcus lubricantis TaxID=1538102 RepID=A0ABX0UW82_9HYPH|nr:hypothetical protein [Pseudochelatococcus lubricantis]